MNRGQAGGVWPFPARGQGPSAQTRAPTGPQDGEEVENRSRAHPEAPEGPCDEQLGGPGCPVANGLMQATGAPVPVPTARGWMRPEEAEPAL